MGADSDLRQEVAQIFGGWGRGAGGQRGPSGAPAWRARCPGAECEYCFEGCNEYLSRLTDVWEGRISLGDARPMWLLNVRCSNDVDGPHELPPSYYGSMFLG